MAHGGKHGGNRAAAARRRAAVARPGGARAAHLRTRRPRRAARHRAAGRRTGHNPGAAHGGCRGRVLRACRGEPSRPAGQRSFLAAGVVSVGRTEYDLAVGRPLQPLRRARAAGPGRGRSRRAEGQRRGARCGDALSARRAARLARVSARRRAALRRVWHAGTRRSAGTGHPWNDHHGRARVHDPGTAAQDRPVSAACLASAGPRRRPPAGERAAVGTGDQGLVLHPAAPVVRARVRRSVARLGLDARPAGRRGGVLGGVDGVAADPAQAPGRVLDGRPDRLSVFVLSAGRRGRAACGRTRLGRHHADARVACTGQGRHVPRRRQPGPGDGQPAHRRPQRDQPLSSAVAARLRAGRRERDGASSQRRFHREVAAAAKRAHERAVGLDRGPGTRQPAERGIRVQGLSPFLRRGSEARPFRVALRRARTQRTRSRTRRHRGGLAAHAPLAWLRIGTPFGVPG